jgi:sugar-specific transcriptional regulator TrmB
MRWTLPPQNEIFWKNVLKHKLNESEWRVLVAFVLDRSGYPTTQETLSSRTGIAQPNISGVMQSLLHLGILVKQKGKESKYELNPEILESDYQPETQSGVEYRKSLKSKEKKGNGDFKKQAKNKKDRDRAAEENIKKMLKETKLKKQKGGWTTFHSDVEQSEVAVLVVANGDGSVIKKKSGERIVIVTMELAEEVCRKVLNINDPKEMVRYMDLRYRDDFMDKYKIEHSY